MAQNQNRILSSPSRAPALVTLRKGRRWRKPSLAGSFLLRAMNKKAIERQAEIDAEVSAEAYFDILATELDVVQQKLADPSGRDEKVLLGFTIELLQRTRDDLRYLHKHYQIVPRRRRR
jgi:hypothetical protein